jgi:hemerythrin
MFEWNESYAVGIPGIDAQHQKLFLIARELHAAMAAGQGRDSLARILDRLVDYTAVHFATEERLLRLNDYPNVAEHKAEHDALSGRVVKFQEEFRAGRVAITVQLLQFIKNWLVRHICGSDTRYAPYIRNRSAA